ncbi:MAG: hypothetical protein FWC50_13915 [Planctomycetaceae bacterium]|nr:hypothetical protein [Planctomycetaceae bacterium]
MSTFEDNSYCWRETYLIMLDPKKRPETCVLLPFLQKLKNKHEIKNLVAEPSGFLQSLTIVSPNDSAAIDVVYREGYDIRTEFAAFADELERHTSSPGERKKIKIARDFSAKIELQHFEQIGDPGVSKTAFPANPAKLTFPRYSGFIRNLKNESNDEPDEFDLAERLDPNTLIQILKLVTRLTGGIAFDPASGLVL